MAPLSKRILPLFVLAALLPFLTGATIMIRGPRVPAAGGSGAWHDSFTIASSDGAYWLWNDPRLTKVVPSVSGNATKLRVRVGNNWTGGGATVKVALYDSSTNLLVGATSGSISSSSNQWVEVTIASTAVTNGTTYYVGSVASTNQIELVSISGQTSGDAYIDWANGYAAFPASPDPFSGSGSAVTYRYGMSMWVE